MSWAEAPWPRPGARTIWTRARSSSGASWATVYRAPDAEVRSNTKNALSGGRANDFKFSRQSLGR